MARQTEDKRRKRTPDQDINTHHRKSANSHTRDTTHPFQSAARAPNNHEQTCGELDGKATALTSKVD